MFSKYLSESDTRSIHWRFLLNIYLSLILEAFTRDFLNYLSESDPGGIRWRFCKIFI